MADNDVITRAEARAKGLKQYYDGLPCSNGHIAKRSVANGGCLACAYETEKRYKAAHPEKIKKKNREYEQNASPERIAAKRLHRDKWERENPEKVRAVQKACREKKPELYRAIDRRARQNRLEAKQAEVRVWRDANRDDPEYKAKASKRAEEWRKANPEGVRKLHNARRARKAAAEGSHTKEDLLAILDRQDWKCADPRCGVSLREKRSLDHIVALSKGGSNYAANIQFLCKPCNSRKHNKDHEVWAREANAASP